MDFMKVLESLESADPTVGPKALRVIADVWEADPNLITEIAAKNYKPILTAVATKAPDLLAEILAASVGK